MSRNVDFANDSDEWHRWDPAFVTLFFLWISVNNQCARIGLRLNKKTVFPMYGVTMLKIRRSVRPSYL